MVVNFNIDNTTSFPSQKLTKAEKIKQYQTVEKWGIAQTESIENVFTFRHNEFTAFGKSQMNENLLLIEEGYFNVNNLQNIEKPYGEKDKAIRYPIKIEHYDIISTSVNLLKGEQLLRGDRTFVYNKSAGFLNEIQRNQSKLVEELTQQIFANAVNEELQATGYKSNMIVNDPKSPTIFGAKGERLDTVNRISKYVTNTVSNELERNANLALEDIKLRDHLKFKRNKGFTKYFGTGIECYKVTRENGNVKTRVVDPRNIDFDLGRDFDFIEEASIIREEEFIPVSQVYDRYYQYLSEEDIAEIELMKGGGNYYSNRSDSFRNNGNVFSKGTVSGVRVAHFEWQSLRKLGILTTWNEDKRPIKQLIGEDHKIDKKAGETVKWYWVPERWRSIKIGESVYIKIEPIPGQFTSIKDIGKNFSEYVGIRTFYPFVSRLIAYQRLYNVVMFHLRLAFARAKGKAMLVDIHQIPKKLGWKIERWLYYLDIHGIAPINSREKNEHGENSNFNQWKEFDLTLGNQINSYISQLDLIKREVEDISGITRQRKGNVSSSETVGGIERSNTQSTATTEVFNFDHSTVGNNLYQKIIDVSQTCLLDDGPRSYVSPDSTRVLYNLQGLGFRNADLGVHVSDNTRDANNLEQFRATVKESFAQKDVTLLELVKVIKTNSLAEMEAIAEDAEQRIKELRAEEASQAQELQQQALEQQKALQEITNHLKKMELDIKRFEIETESKTDVLVAEIRSAAQVYGFRADINADANNNNVPDIMELAKQRREDEKLQIQRQQANDNRVIKEKELAIKEKQLDAKKAKESSKKS